MFKWKMNIKSRSFYFSINVPWILSWISFPVHPSPPFRSPLSWSLHNFISICWITIFVKRGRCYLFYCGKIPLFFAVRIYARQYNIFMMFIYKLKHKVIEWSFPRNMRAQQLVARRILCARVHASIIQCDNVHTCVDVHSQMRTYVSQMRRALRPHIRTDCTYMRTRSRTHVTIGMYG